MLSPKIDLTANGDFGLDVGFLMDTPIEIPLDEYEVMSSDEYEALLWWEGIFGRKGHRSDKLNIFGDRRGVSRNGVRKCYRCGKEIRVPWKMRYDNMCLDCYKMDYNSFQRIPWAKRYSQRNDDRGRDLFARR